MNTPGWSHKEMRWYWPGYPKFVNGKVEHYPKMEENEPVEKCTDGCCAYLPEESETPPGAVDRVPDHYQGDGLSPFEVIDAFNLDFYEGNAIKYILRWRRKGGVNDLEKAKHYIDELIRRAE